MEKVASTPNDPYKQVSKRTVRALRQQVFKESLSREGLSRLGPRTITADTDFTWSIDDWYGLQLSPNGDCKSPTVEIEGMKYTIALYPRGAGGARETHISVFLHVEPADPNQVEWKVPCTFALLVWNPLRPAVHRALEIKDFEFNFVGELNWGCAKLCELSATDSLVQDGKVNITVYLRVYDDDKF